MHNGIGGEMLLHHGVTLDNVGLVNQGLLGIRRFGPTDQAGLVSVDRFTNDSQGTMQFRLGGYVLGDEFDHVAVTGGAATLDGLLEVLLTDDGDGLFLPQIGDEFIILTAIGGVTGQFINDPVSAAAGKLFHWSVLYHPNDVTLRLADISVPEPSSVTLAALGAIAFGHRRRIGRRIRVRDFSTFLDSDKRNGDRLWQVVSGCV